MQYRKEKIDSPFILFKDSVQLVTTRRLPTDLLKSPGNAKYRPIGLAVGPDGALYIADSEKGRIWRVVYTGKQ